MSFTTTAGSVSLIVTSATCLKPSSRHVVDGEAPAPAPSGRKLAVMLYRTWSPLPRGCQSRTPRVAEAGMVKLTTFAPAVSAACSPDLDPQYRQSISACGIERQKQHRNSTDTETAQKQHRNSTDTTHSHSTRPHPKRHSTVTRSQSPPISPGGALQIPCRWRRCCRKRARRNGAPKESCRGHCTRAVVALPATPGSATVTCRSEEIGRQHRLQAPLSTALSTALSIQYA